MGPGLLKIYLFPEYVTQFPKNVIWFPKIVTWFLENVTQFPKIFDKLYNKKV